MTTTNSGLRLRRLSRSWPAVVTVAAVVSLQLATTLPAAAAPGPVMQPTASVVTADALPTDQINGVVWTQVVVGTTVYAGGEFSSVRPAGAAAGTNESPRSNLMSYDLVTGKATSFAPVVDGAVKALAVSADQKTLFVGGNFLTVDNKVRHRFATFTIATGALGAAAPDLNAQVSSLAVTPSAVYLGGRFSTVNGSDRGRLAALSSTTFGLLPWAPSADGEVTAMVATPDKKRIVVGGAFGVLNSTVTRGMGSLDATTAILQPWAINTVVQDWDTDDKTTTGSGITNLTTDGTSIYGGGFAFGAGNYEGAFAADPTTGAVTWLQDCHGDTYSVAPIGDTVYSVGHPHFCGNIGGFPDTNPRVFHRALAVTRAATGTVLTNGAPGTHHGNFVGQPAPSLYNWFPDLTAGSYTGQTQAAWSVTGSSSYLALGGEFTAVNGTPQQGLVRMTIPAKAPNLRGPLAPVREMVPTLTPEQSSVKISWTANWDADDQLLTYDVLRAGVVVKTFKAVSQFWNRPTLSWSDPGGKPGTSYGYSVRVRDPHGNAKTSDRVSVVFPSDTAYAQRIVADGAAHQWRLGSPAGSGSDPDSVGSLPLPVNANVTFGVAGALPADADTAARFSGSAHTALTTAPGATSSIEGWFRTTDHSKGSLVAFGAVDRTKPVAGDRQVYLTAAGTLAYTERSTDTTATTITSAKAYDDDAWHQLVAVRSSTSLELFVDGSRVASRANPAALPQTDGSWTLGGGAAGATYQGSLDDVAVFGSALSVRQVRDHYLLAQPGLAVVDVNPRRR